MKYLGFFQSTSMPLKRHIPADLMQFVSRCKTYTLEDRSDSTALFLFDSSVEMLRRERTDNVTNPFDSTRQWFGVVPEHWCSDIFLKPPFTSPF
jgi:hypothetical protein